MKTQLTKEHREMLEKMLTWDLGNHLNHDIIGILSESTVIEEAVEPRKEQCVKCNVMTSEWLDTDWSHGRICPRCYQMHNPEKSAKNPFAPFKGPFRYDMMGQLIISDGDSTTGDVVVLDVRGHGYLVGGRMNLSEEEAARIQDRFGKAVAALMNQAAGGNKV